MLVIGNGMLARAFAGARSKEESLVAFCSGVSHSGETAQVQFDRERALLLETVTHHAGKKIIYFSSCAAGVVDSPYYRHKQAMQELIQDSAKRYLVVRLPQVVGVTKNSTLVSFIAGNIKNRTPITVFKGARRNLIDVDDVVRLTLYLAGLDNMVINVTNSSMVPVEEIIRIIAGILSAEPVILAGQATGKELDYEGATLKELIGASDPIYSPGYNQAVLAKYIPLIG